MADTSAPNANGRVIAMLNIKGGVGKTVLAANLFTAAHLVEGRSVCFVDLDPQHNLSHYFLPPTERNKARETNRTLYSIFTGASSEPPLRVPVTLNRTKGPAVSGLDLVVGDERLFEYTLDLATPPDRQSAFDRFHNLIAALKTKYQAVVIDTNPCATFLTRCAVTASDHIVAPVRPEKYSLSGLNLLEYVTRTIRERAVRPDEFSVVLNGFGLRRDNSDASTREEIATAPFFGSTLIPLAIPYSALLRAGPTDRYAPNPINVTAIMRFSQRALKETLTGVAHQILARAGAEAVHAPTDTPRA